MRDDRRIDMERRRAAGNARSFWVSGSGYYVLIVALSAGCFFVFWGILNDSGIEMPWITAGVAASIMLAGGVVLREVVIRRYRRKQIPIALSDFGIERDRRSRNKLSIERNTALLAGIKQKSDAAKILNNLAAGHREVFEMSAEYLSLVERELHAVSPSSPRLAALLKGRTKASAYHRFHMLRWAEIEATELTLEARSSVDREQKAEAAQNALAVVEHALDSYSSERPLKESHELLTELVASIRVTGYIEDADKARATGDLATARNLYREALFYLGRDNIHTPEREAAAARIRNAIEELREVDHDNL